MIFDNNLKIFKKKSRYLSKKPKKPQEEPNGGKNGSSSGGFVVQKAKHVLPLLQEDAGGFMMTPVMVRCGKELNHPQNPAGCGGNWRGSVPGEAAILADPWQSSALR